MTGIETIEGQLTIQGARIALLVSRFNSFVVESLLSGAIDTLQRHGAQDSELQIVRVPGAFEMPIVAKRLAATQHYDAIIALGAVIRGGTPPFYGPLATKWTLVTDPELLKKSVYTDTDQDYATQIALKAYRRIIQEHYDKHGAYPETVEGLVVPEWGFSVSDPHMDQPWDYDPNTGTIRSKTHPEW